MENEENKTTEQGQITKHSDFQPKSPESVAPPSAIKTITAQEDSNVALGVQGGPLPEGPAIIGRKKIMIPSEAQQRAGFKIEQSLVNLLIVQFPQFKYYNKDKGQLPV